MHLTSVSILQLIIFNKIKCTMSLSYLHYSQVTKHVMATWSSLLSFRIAQAAEGAGAQSTMSSQTVYLQLQALFLFAVVWSLGSVLPSESRVKFDSFFRDLVSGVNSEHPKPKSIKLTKNNSFPERMTIYDFWYDKRSAGSWHEWSQYVMMSIDVTTKPEHGPGGVDGENAEGLAEPLDIGAPRMSMSAAAQVNEAGSDLIVATVETARMNYFLNLYTVNYVPLLLIGPTGE